MIVVEYCDSVMNISICYYNRNLFIFLLGFFYHDIESQVMEFNIISEFGKIKLDLKSCVKNLV